jgi:hypothetical protein
VLSEESAPTSDSDAREDDQRSQWNVPAERHPESSNGREEKSEHHRPRRAHSVREEAISMDMRPTFRV